MNLATKKRPLDPREAFLLAAARVALQKLEELCPNAPETALLMLAIQKFSGVRTAES